MADSTEAIDIATLARAGMKVLEGGTGWGTFVVPDGYSLATVDETPGGRRSQGSIAVHDATSFLDAVHARRLSTVAPGIYADEEAKDLVAVLDDDLGDTPGRRAYRVSLALRATPEWAAWKSRSGRNQEQEDFAEFIEEHIGDITDPPGAVMLELAQSIEGTAQADFAAGHRLQSGARQVMWKETVKAGSGAIEIPPKFTIAVSPFFGAVPVDVDALLRFRINGGHLLLSYKLVDPDKVERDVFATIVNAVESSGAISTVVRGPAPQPTWKE